MLKGIPHAIIWTGDLQRLVSFYRDKLGLTIELEEEQGFVLFKSEAGAQLGIGYHSEIEGKSRDPLRVMLDFAVDDIQATYEALKGKGVEFMRPPTEEGGFVVATFNDPDGNTLQLFQETG